MNTAPRIETAGAYTTVNGMQRIEAASTCTIVNGIPRTKNKQTRRPESGFKIIPRKDAHINLTDVRESKMQMATPRLSRLQPGGKYTDTPATSAEARQKQQTM